MKTLVALLFTLASTAGAQSDGISAPVSRTVNLAADEASITISVSAPLDSTQQQVKQALQDAGLPNPTVVATGLAPDGALSAAGRPLVLYSATVVIAAASAIDTAKSLENLRTHLPAALTGFDYAMTFNASQSSIDAMRQTLLPQLLDESRRQAQALAAAAGVRLGGIRAIGDVAGSYVNGYASAVLRVYDPATGIQFSQPSNTRFTFYLNVVFAAAP